MTSYIISIFSRKCKHNRCLKDVNNPSLENKLCQQFKDTTVFDLSTDISVVVLRGAEGPKVLCYPWESETIKSVSSANHKPYAGGWCDTCETGDKECMVTPEDNWGWCVPGCDGSQDQNRDKMYRQRVHELPVDAFVYENCSVNVDTRTEFCTGSAIAQGKMREYSYKEPKDDLEPFTMGRTVPRQLHPGDIGWNGNGTIIRPGARYQGRQHSSYEGDSCFGDAGGSVWKYWKFRNPASGSKDWSKGKKLAVLTGVISRYTIIKISFPVDNFTIFYRFERMCGAFSPWPSQEVGDEPNLPTQHTVHARVQNHLEWISQNVFAEGSCG